MSILGLNHVGLSCRDLDLQRRFWCDGLGLPEVAGFSWDAGNAAADAGLGLADTAADCVIWHLGNVFVEAFTFRSPEPLSVHGPGWARLDLAVSDVDEFRSRALAHGGIDLDARAVADPDGNVLFPVEIAELAVEDRPDLPPLSPYVLGLSGVTLAATDVDGAEAWWSSVDRVHVEGLDRDAVLGPGRRICDLGINHVCVDVDDIGTTFAALSAAGLTANVPPVRMPAGHASIGYAWDPWGHALELLESYDAEATLWRGRLVRRFP